MVLAAGFGTRMGALTRRCPKPLLPVAGRPMIDLTLDHLDAAGVARAVVNLHYLGDAIRQHLSSRTLPVISFSDEQPQILDTGGGVVQALPLLGDRPFVTINSDAVFVGRNPVEILLEHWNVSSAYVDALMLLVARESAIAYTRQGDFLLSGTGDVPMRRGMRDRAPYIYAGAQIIRPSAFDGMPGGAFSTNLVWDRLITAERIQAIVYPGHWVDVGTPQGLRAADAALLAA